MSLRDDLANAASTVAGVKVTPYYRQNGQPGQGFVRLDRRNRDASGFGWMDTWQVWIVLPQDLAKAEAWLETRLTSLGAALEPHMVVTSIAPSTLLLDSGAIPGVVIEGAREG